MWHFRPSQPKQSTQFGLKSLIRLMSVKCYRASHQYQFDNTKIRLKYFNGTPALLIAHWIIMHLRVRLKPPRLKQILWSNKLSIEWRRWWTSSAMATHPTHSRRQHYYPHQVLIKLCSHSKALRFLLKLFEVQQQMFGANRFAVGCCGGDCVFVVTVNFKYFRLSIEWPAIGAHRGAASPKTMFVLRFDYVWDKCWGLVDYAVTGGFGVWH